MGATTEEGPRTLVVGRRMRGSRWGWVWRRGWVIVVTTVLAAVAALAVSHARTVKYVAEAVLVVQSGASGNGPGSANEAATLAQTYAGLIPQDGAILQVVSSGLGLPALAVQRDITVTIQNGTSILDVHFTDASPSVALAGAAAVAQAVSGPAPATPTIPGGSVVLVHLPTVASQTHSAAGEVVPLGIILGLVLGAVLVVIWERVDGRVDAAADLAGEVDFPTWDADELSPGLASALVVRWRALTGGGPARVVLVVVGSRLDARATAVGEVLRAARNLPPDAPPSVGTAFDGHGTTGGAGEQLRLDIVAVGPWAPQGGGGLAALGADLTVLVVAAGSRVREVQGIVATLDELGASPGWGLVIARSRKVAPLDESALRVASYPARGFRALQRLGSARGFRALQRVGSARGFRALQRLGSAGSQRLVEPILRRLGVRGGEGEVAADVPVEVPAGLPDPAPPGAVNGNGQHPPGVVASRPMDRGASPPELVDDVPERVSGSTVSR